MPISDGKYVSPTWVNGAAPALTATEMQAITDTLELVPVANGGTGATSLDTFKRNLQVPLFVKLSLTASTSAGADLRLHLVDSTQCDYARFDISDFSGGYLCATVTGAFVNNSNYTIDENTYGDFYISGIQQEDDIFYFFFNRNLHIATETLTVNVVIAKWVY